jgi:hypothetical protein
MDEWSHSKRLFDRDNLSAEEIAFCQSKSVDYLALPVTEEWIDEHAGLFTLRNGLLTDFSINDDLITFVLSNIEWMMNEATKQNLHLGTFMIQTMIQFIRWQNGLNNTRSKYIGLGVFDQAYKEVLRYFCYTGSAHDFYKCMEARIDRFIRTLNDRYIDYLGEFMESSNGHPVVVTSDIVAFIREKRYDILCRDISVIDVINGFTKGSMSWNDAEPLAHYFVAMNELGAACLDVVVDRRLKEQAELERFVDMRLREQKGIYR